MSVLSPTISLKQQALELLRRSLDNPQATFRDGQWEAIDGLVRDKARLLVVQRTGWGKSVVYFLATRLLRDKGSGPTLLISPLLALMRNQILAANRIGVRAESIDSSNTDDWERIQTDLHNNKIDLLLVSPERLANEAFREDVLMPIAERVGLFVVDEAHCISDWGHDFRPDYHRIVRILQALPRNIPVLTTTATANDRVVEDVVNQIGELRVVRGPLARASLRLQNISLPSQAERLAWLAEQVPHLIGSGIIYTLTVRDAKRVAEWLQKRGIDAHAYFGDLETSSRKALETKLLKNKIKALVATSALGMGFDKPYLGFVIHFQRPRSVIHYYQQVGRAGRALETAHAVLLGGREDDEIADYFLRTSFPPEAHVKDVLKALKHADKGLSMTGLQQKLNLSYTQIEKVLKALAVEHPSPVAKFESKWYLAPVRYAPDKRKIERLIQVRRQEQERMREFLHSSICLMAFLQKELDDPNPEPCGRCAVCSGAPLLPENYTSATVNDAIKFLQRCYQEFEPRKIWIGDSLSAYGWKGRIHEELRAQEGWALCMWGDAGWGTLVRRGKQDGRFDDELVTAAADMVQQHWKPNPPPTWVTCIPSLRHTNLVPDFAQRLAEALHLPLITCLQQKHRIPPQKEMANSYKQAQNLAGIFKADSKQIRPEPVLLIDDMVDSRWTFTVASALLLEAGSGPVYPFALAMTTAG
ncbi:RecQ family ATP-dependent DNA helicase [bacterium]|nr:RecQ family ATP-dependent DNA helicase [bacterium]